MSTLASVLSAGKIDCLSQSTLETNTGRYSLILAPNMKAARSAAGAITVSNKLPYRPVDKAQEL